ncbi:MAG TPA: cysteine desulfurase family protein [Acidimicrobiales bacterium]|nr:cysteine desulfurase family protein [Acidimicrobiales bacterium]
MPEPITYLDHAATTPLRPEARAAMLPWLGERFGNPSGAHRVARAARQAVDEARDAVAEVVGCRPGDVVFTGGGTEADNLAIRGAHAARPGAVLCSAVEHEAVLKPVRQVGGTTVAVDQRGALDLDALEDALSPEVTLVSVMAANNEIGTVQPVAEAVELVQRRAPEAVVHTDAVQAAAWLDLTAVAGGAHLIAISSHKVGGPQGVGALVVRPRTALRPLLLGGGQERELRSGTHNVAGIVGMAAALRAAAAGRRATTGRVAALRERLASGLLAAIPGAVETSVSAISATHESGGTAGRRLPGTLHLCIPGIESEALLFLLDEAGVCASAASACASGAQQASHVLAAMGVTPALGSGALRLSLGWTSTAADVDRALDVIPPAVARLRGASAPVAQHVQGSRA